MTQERLCVELHFCHPMTLASVLAYRDVVAALMNAEQEASRRAAP